MIQLVRVPQIEPPIFDVLMEHKFVGQASRNRFLQTMEVSQRERFQIAQEIAKHYGILPEEVKVFGPPKPFQEDDDS